MIEVRGRRLIRRRQCSSGRSDPEQLAGDGEQSSEGVLCGATHLTEAGDARLASLLSPRAGIRHRDGHAMAILEHLRESTKPESELSLSLSASCNMIGTSSLPPCRCYP
jgi:hypothetical protein